MKAASEFAAVLTPAILYTGNSLKVLGQFALGSDQTKNIPLATVIWRLLADLCPL